MHNHDYEHLFASAKVNDNHILISLVFNKQKQTSKITLNCYGIFLRNSYNSIHTEMYLNDQHTTTRTKTVNLFVDFFKSGFEECPINNNISIANVSELVDDFYVTHKDVYEVNSSIKSFTSLGPDGINNLCHYYLLSFIINISLKSSQYPNLWKQSFIIPEYMEIGIW